MKAPLSHLISKHTKTKFPDLERIPEAIKWLSPMIRIDKHGGMSPSDPDGVRRRFS